MNVDTRELATRRCHAHKTNGENCPNWAIRGGTVCHVHGGRAPQVKQAAQDRLRNLVDPAITRLEILINDEMSSVALAAVKDVLDRNGFKATEKVEATLLKSFTLRIDRGTDDDVG